MPLLRGLRILQEQEESTKFKNVLFEVSQSIESGNPLSEAMAAHPQIFNNLYISMVKAGELGGALEITLRRLSEFMEKAQKIKGKVQSAMFYPVAVLLVSTGIVGVLMTFIIPRFQQVFEGLPNGGKLPAFTLGLMHASAFLRAHFLLGAACVFGVTLFIAFAIRTRYGRRVLDHLKLKAPLLGPVFRKATISRFSRTLGTLLQSGVPILQALEIVRDTAGNVVLGNTVTRIRDCVKEGETMASQVKASPVFPPVVAGMVDVGEQTGALPDMLMKIADTYDEDVDNAVIAMTSLLEPIMIIFLAIIVGGIVIAMFLPIIQIVDPPGGGGPGGE